MPRVARRPTVRGELPSFPPAAIDKSCRLLRANARGSFSELFSCHSCPLPHFLSLSNVLSVIHHFLFVPSIMASVNGEVPPPLAGKKRRIGVLTSGGDAPGMNGVVRAVVRMSIAKGCEPYAVYEGYEGLVQGGDLIKRMEWPDVRNWVSIGGTLIGTARCKAFYERPGRLRAAKNMILNGIDALIICGGDGSLTGADKFRDEWPGLLQELVEDKDLSSDEIAPFKQLNIVGLVGSIDNDMSSTDATIGCYSSLGTICESVDKIDATAMSHQRAFVIEVMGRHCGWLALMAALSTGADFVFIPEKPPAKDWEKQMCAIIKQAS